MFEVNDAELFMLLGERDVIIHKKDKEIKFLNEQVLTLKSAVDGKIEELSLLKEKELQNTKDTF